MSRWKQLNFVKNFFKYLSKLSLHISRLSFEEKIVPGNLNISRVTLVFQAGYAFGYYKPVSVFLTNLPCFSKILDRIIHKQLLNHLPKHKIIYQKQLCFHQGHCNEHAFMQLIDQINNNFKNNCFVLGVAIDLLKALNTGVEGND